MSNEDEDAKQHQLAVDQYRKITRLRALDREAEEIRKELGVSKPGEIIFNQSQSVDRSIVVVASGYGPATVQVVDGEYDSQNSQSLASREYGTEADALARASEMYENDEDEEALEEREDS